MDSKRRELLGFLGMAGMSGVLLAKVADSAERDKIETLTLTHTWSAPNGEKIIAMAVFDGRLYVATPSRMYLLN